MEINQVHEYTCNDLTSNLVRFSTKKDFVMNCNVFNEQCIKQFGSSLPNPLRGC